MHGFGIGLIVVVGLLFFLFIYAISQGARVSEFFADLGKMIGLGIGCIAGLFAIAGAYVLGVLASALPFLVIFGGACLLVKCVFF
jgi:hypothetical protein